MFPRKKEMAFSVAAVVVVWLVPLVVGWVLSLQRQEPHLLLSTLMSAFVCLVSTALASGFFFFLAPLRLCALAVVLAQECGRLGLAYGYRRYERDQRYDASTAAAMGLGFAATRAFAFETGRCALARAFTTLVLHLLDLALCRLALEAFASARSRRRRNIVAAMLLSRLAAAASTLLLPDTPCAKALPLPCAVLALTLLFCQRITSSSSQEREKTARSPQQQHNTSSPARSI